MATPPPPSEVAGPVVLVCGDDEFTVKRRARQIFGQWKSGLGGIDHEIIEAHCTNVGQVMEAVSKLREALNTRSFFGGDKAIWLKDCSFLGEDRTSSSASVTAVLTDLVNDLSKFRWESVRLLLSAGKADKRRAFFKWIDRVGRVEWYLALSGDDKDWATRAEGEVLKALKAAGVEIRDDALSELVARVGPDLPALVNEVEKTVLYAGDRKLVTVEDVRTVTTQQKQAQAFALSEALGERDLPKIMRLLDRELWEVRSGIDKNKSEIGLLYGLIGKVRSLLLLREMRDRGWIKAGSDYSSFRSQMERVPADQMPEDRRFNPLLLHAYVAFLAFRQSDNYSGPELSRAMEVLLEANLNLVGSSIDEGTVLRQALVEIVGTAPRASSRRSVH